MKKLRAKITFLDAGVILGLAAAALWLYLKARANLDYDWDWSIVGRYFINIDQQTGQWQANLLLKGLFTTIRLSIWSTVLACLMGGILGMLRISPRLFRRLVGSGYVGLIRNLPPLVLVFIFFYFFSDQIIPALGLDRCVRDCAPLTTAIIELLFGPISLFPAFISAVFTLAVYEGAYITEIVRSGLESIDRGQWEASAALGMSRLQQLRYIIGPQAIRRMLPPLAGQFISTIKDSAIVSIISIQELTFQGLELMASTYRTYEIWITITAMYFVLTFSLSIVLERVFVRFRQN